MRRATTCAARDTTPSYLCMRQSSEHNILNARTRDRTGRSMSSAPRQLPPPWRINMTTSGYVIRDANGQDIAHVHWRHNEADAIRAKVLTHKEALVIATAIAQLPNLFGDKSEQ